MNDTLKKRIEMFERIDVYPVISSEFCDGRHPGDILKAVGEGGARIAQLREKSMSKSHIAKLAREFREITDAYGMLLIINDHVDIALECGADGVHLGLDDAPLREALCIAPDLIIGASTHSEEEASAAIAAGASYINIGPIFRTGTKKLPMEPLGLDVLRKIIPQVDIPFTVMGGIKARHIPELVSLGAARIAMVTEISQAQEVADKTRELRALIAAAKK